MPNSRSSAKRLRNQTRKAERNKAVISELKTLSQKLITLAATPDQAKEYAAKVISKYDRAVSSGAIPKGRADRKKSRVALFLNKLTKTTKKTKAKKKTTAKASKAK
ncbi:MAG: 30S ribosomal protein S20 [Candidatus Omnitrophica bacterium]|nr:30S ribosomal protein S20 [Candidatus Omnitrophota bacterium]